METAGNSGKKLWRPSWKGVIITLLVGSNIILIRIIESLVSKGQSLEKEISQITQSSADQRLVDIKKQLCVNTSRTLECVMCPDGWLRYRENCYYISSGIDYRTWDESREQQEFINRSIKQQTDRKFWMGLYRDGGGWRWVDGGHYDTDLLQISEEYSGDCVWWEADYFHRYPRLEGYSGYNKDDCLSKHNWICQKRSLKI